MKNKSLHLSFKTYFQNQKEYRNRGRISRENITAINNLKRAGIFNHLK